MMPSPPGRIAMKWYNSLIFKTIFCSVVLIFCLIGSVFYVLYQYQESMLAEMERKSAEIVDEFEIKLRTLDVDKISGEVFKDRFSGIENRHGVDGVTLYDSDKNVVTSLDSGVVPLLELGKVRQFVGTVPGRPGTRYVQIFPLMVDNQAVGYVEIRLQISPQTHLVKALQSHVFIALFTLFMTTLSALCYFMFNLLRPLHAMADTCREISEGNLREIDIKPNASEVLVLEMKFNEMIQALQTKAQVEQKLVQAERLSALGNLAAGVAHEIGNPLNGIKLTVSHLKDMSARNELDGASFDTYADSILAEVSRLDRIVRDFLTLAKEREISLQPYSLGKLISETVHLIEKDARARGIAIETDVDSAGKEALIDPQMLKGAIINLLINAMEASETAGTISVTLAEDDGEMTLKITDRGHGIPDDILERIFDPYFSTKSSGTGLGLPLTRTIIEKHNGDISVESKKGEGTTVTVTLPAGGEEE